MSLVEGCHATGRHHEETTEMPLQAQYILYMHGSKTVLKTIYSENDIRAFEPRRTDLPTRIALCELFSTWFMASAVYKRFQHEV